eukprot:TRINITY_DN1008_c0_g2_i1.p1 TRINITY_DN1008_c0_g2~~TRINITY_DN1008_c0_g2_i1.p1  ORF type:complete len:658 (+),score=136.82 TRINITY_DN1008_c0_g2_i1:96-2069(+)
MEVEEHELDPVSCWHLMQKRPREVVEETERVGSEEPAEHELIEQEVQKIDRESLEEEVQEDIDEAEFECELEDHLENCGCSRDHFSSIPKRELSLLVKSLASLPRKAFKLVVSGVILSAYAPPEREVVIRRDRPGQVRKRMRKDDTRASFRYHILGHEICRSGLMKLFGLSQEGFQSIANHIRMHSGVTKELCEDHRGGDQRSKKGEDVDEKTLKDEVVDFLSVVGEKYGYPCPSIHPPGKTREDETLQQTVHVLPCGVLKYRVWEEFIEERKTECSYWHFCRLWTEHVKFVKIATSGTDYCSTCTFLKMTRPEGWKSLLLDHTRLADQERGYFTKVIDHTKEHPHAMMHLTFDFAESVRIPHYAQEPASAFRKSLFQVYVFGISNDTSGEHRLYCIPEGCHVNEAPQSRNNIISMLDHYIRMFVPESVTELYLHADNCPGQNKSQYVMQYMAYLVAIGRFQKISYAFMMAGHTKCTTDGAFGVMKRAFYRRHTIQTTDDVMEVVNGSSEHIHHVDTSTGEVQWHDWGEFFSQFRCQAMPEISRHHVFEFERSPNPLSVNMYEWSSDLLVEGRGECLRLFPSHIRAEMLAHPAEHGGKNVSEFTLNPSQLSKKRHDVLHDLLPKFLNAEGKMWWKEKYPEIMADRPVAKRGRPKKNL